MILQALSMMYLAKPEMVACALHQFLHGDCMPCMLPSPEGELTLS